MRFKINEPYASGVPEGPSWFLAITEVRQSRADDIIARVKKKFEGSWPTGAPIYVDIGSPCEEQEVCDAIINALRKKKWSAEFTGDGDQLKLTPILEE